MARRKSASPAKPKMTKAEKEEADTTRRVAFKGGPRDGFRMTIGKNLQREYMRFGFPEWATYHWDVAETLYVYVGPDPAPAGAGLVRRPSTEGRATVVPVVVDPADVDLSHRETAGWKRGRRMAEDTMAGLL